MLLHSKYSFNTHFYNIQKCFYNTFFITSYKMALLSIALRTIKNSSAHSSLSALERFALNVICFLVFFEGGSEF